MNQKELDLAQIIANHDGQGNAPEVVAALAGGKPRLVVLSALAKFGAQKCRPNILKYALSFVWSGDDGSVIPHAFDESFTENGQVRWRGKSVWDHLVSGGLGPGDASFDETLRVLAGSSVPINTQMFMGGASDKHAGCLLSSLACRGWLSQIKLIETLSGDKFNPDGLPEPSHKRAPLAMALLCGQGEVAKWLDGRGAAFPAECLDWAAKGLAAPMSPSEGRYSNPSSGNRLLGFRMAAWRSGLIEADARPWSDAGQHVKSERAALMMWTMAKAAHAQAASLPFEDRRRAAALWIAAQSGAPKKVVLGAEPRKAEQAASRGIFAWMKPPRAKAGAEPRPAEGGAAGSWPSGPAEIWQRAEELVKQRDLAAPPISKAIEWLDQGMVSEAQEIIEGLSPRDATEACVALLGLAKLGFWDMGSDEAAPNAHRHPLRWAGFKTAIACAGSEGLNRPLAGLQGVTLLGLAAVLGFADVCSELIHAGAAVDPDQRFNACSALALATANGHDDIAKALLCAGASPLEGARIDAFGFEKKAWAIHLAIKHLNLSLAEAMLRADPRCAQLPNEKGQNAWEAAFERREAAGDGANAESWAEMEALAQRALIEAAAGPKAAGSRELVSQEERLGGEPSVAKKQELGSEDQTMDAPRRASTRSRL